MATTTTRAASANGCAIINTAKDRQAKRAAAKTMHDAMWRAGRAGVLAVRSLLSALAVAPRREKRSAWTSTCRGASARPNSQLGSLKY